MPNAPQNPYTALAQAPIVPTVWIGFGDDPPSEPAPWLRVLKVFRSCGGKKLDYAVLEYDLAGQGERIVIASR